MGLADLVPETTKPWFQMLNWFPLRMSAKMSWTVLLICISGFTLSPQPRTPYNTLKLKQSNLKARLYVKKSKEVVTSKLKRGITSAVY